MLTPEQIKNLKEGDTVLVEAKVSRPQANGAVVAHGCIIQALPASDLYPLPSEHGTSVPTTKHDPTRLFKVGDKVKRRTVDGRTDPDVAKGIDLTVTIGEDKYGNVHVKEPRGRSIVTKSVFLELVTPVEELARYRVELLQDGLPPDTYHFWAVMDKMGHEVARFWCEQYEEGKAKAAAEAERDRLNAEWRKEQE